MIALTVKTKRMKLLENIGEMFRTFDWARMLLDKSPKQRK
jgi:hypothetical protein